MTRYFYIVLFALGLTACATSQVPLDDAYYWPDKATTSSAAQTTQTTQSTQTEPAPQEAPSVEFISVKDTTVTVKIKR